MIVSEFTCHKADLRTKALKSCKATWIKTFADAGEAFEDITKKRVVEHPKHDHSLVTWRNLTDKQFDEYLEQVAGTAQEEQC